MVIVNAVDSIKTSIKLDKEIANEPTDAEIEEYLIKGGNGDVIKLDKEFMDRHGNVKRGFFLNTWLKDNLDNYLIRAVKKRWDGCVCVSGMEGCLTGDTLININRCELHNLKHIYTQWKSNKSWNQQPIYVRSYDGESIRLHKINDVVYSGKKEVWKMILENGRNIKATKDHKIMTKRGWIELQNLTLKDEIMCDNIIYSKLKIKEHIGIEDTYDIVCEKPYHNFVANGIVVHNSGKSTGVMAIAKYCDPTFPGRPLRDGTNRRATDRIVFTAEDLMNAIDDSKPEQAIVFDEAVMGFLASDASSEIQRILIKKMVTIRKKRLYIFFVIPSIFILRKYMAVFRTRALIHFFSPDGVSRGVFKFYSYETKRKLFFRGLKEFNQSCVKQDFIGEFVDTTGYFFDQDEYEMKKDKAIASLTAPKKDKQKKTEKKYKNQRDGFYCVLSALLEEKGLKKNKEKSDYLLEKAGYGLKLSAQALAFMQKDGLRFIKENFEKKEEDSLENIQIHPKLRN